MQFSICLCCGQCYVIRFAIIKRSLASKNEKMADVLFCMQRNGAAMIDLCKPSALNEVLYDKDPSMLKYICIGIHFQEFHIQRICVWNVLKRDKLQYTIDLKIA